MLSSESKGDIFIYTNAFLTLSKSISLNSFLETNIFSNIIFSSRVTTTLTLETMLLLRTDVDKTYHHLLQFMLLIPQHFFKVII